MLRTSYLLVMVLALAVGIATANPYDQPGPAAPAAGPAVAPPSAPPASSLTAPPPAQGAAKAGSPATTPVAPANPFLGQPGEFGAWDHDGNPITKPAWLVSEDANKVRRVVKGMENADLELANARLRRLANARAMLCRELGLNPSPVKTSDKDIVDAIRVKTGFLMKLVLGLTALSLLSLALAVWLLFTKADKPKKPEQRRGAFLAGAGTQPTQ